MKKVFAVFPILLVLSVLPAFAQEAGAAKYPFRGVIRDQNSAVVPGLRLLVNGEAKTRTDVNGEFRILLSDGDYVVTADELDVDKFRVFIRITDKGVNPDYLEFSVDSEAIACSGNRTKPSPKVLSSVEPKYPAAARAVRAVGDVSVIVTITPTGSVSSPKALSGHPLLRRASEVAAEKFVFAPTDEAGEREAIITFIFSPDSEKPGLMRYQCPYRIMVADPLELIQTRSH